MSPGAKRLKDRSMSVVRGNESQSGGKRGKKEGASGAEKSYHKVVRVGCGGFKS